jgi:hypothetical protein
VRRTRPWAPNRLRSAAKLPALTISIVTPSYNQGAFIDDAIGSVVTQGYPSLEYVVIDGASTDGALDIIRRHSDQLTHWESCSDNGMYDALNKGFDRPTGEILGWLNSDDVFFPWTLAVVSDIFGSLPHVEWLASRLFTVLDIDGRVVSSRWVRGYSREGFNRAEHFPIGGHWFTTTSIPTEATFWRRSLWERAGGQMDTGLECSADWDLWARFNQHAHLHGVTVPLAAQRKYAEQKSVVLESQCIEEAKQIMTRYGITPRSAFRSRWCARAALYLPARIAHLAGAVHRTQNVVFRDGAWIVESGYSGLV